MKNPMTVSEYLRHIADEVEDVAISLNSVHHERWSIEIGFSSWRDNGVISIQLKPKGALSEDDILCVVSEPMYPKQALAKMLSKE